MVKRLIFALAALMALAVVGVASAGSLPASGSGTIALGSVDGTAMGFARLAPHYKGTVAFTTTGTSGLKNPRVWVACYQYGVLVYGAGGAPSENFKLGGDMSQWVLNGGGAANCTADLYYIVNAKGTGEWNGHGAQGGFVYLGNTGFDATG
jgi:hypothetical protein